MKNKPIFQKISNAACVNSTPLSELENLDADSAQSLAALTIEEMQEYIEFQPGIKKLLARQFKQKKTAAELAQIISAAQNAGFPDVQGRLSGRSVIEIYPHGGMPVPGEDK